jgi:type IV pilus assembly protein PilA
MLHRLRQRAAGESGFTLIELLVVILIIGILAAIAIPSFINQRGKANDADAKAIARTAQTAEETYFTDNQTYTSTKTDLTTIEKTLSDAATVCAAGNTNGPCGLTAVAGLATKGGAASTIDKSFAVTVTSKTGTKFTITRNADGTVVRSCDTAGGGCKSDNTW